MPHLKCVVLLKRLTLKNFKSFRSAVIPFSEGFTAIMGPNGSGKSNIIDALIFVLGEGRLKLVRASRLRDLVNVKAKDGEAVVSLDIEDGDKKYTITRTINKKGQSVYKINGKRSTKHEVLSLLSSFGLSQKGYNFVLQGEVTRLIKMTPMERRQVIDEIAGIAEYEEKKEEAIRKLEDVEQRIKEASIVLGEREELLRKLEIEKANAEKYLKLKEEAANIRKSLLARQLKKLEKEIKSKEMRLEEIKEEVEKLRGEREELQLKLERLENKSKELTDKISSIYGEMGEGELAVLERDEEKIRSEIKYLKEKIEGGEIRRRKLLEEKETVEKQIAEIKAEINAVERRLREKNEELLELRKEIKKLEEIIKSEEGERLSIQRKLDEIELEIGKLREEYARLREEYGRLEGEYNARIEEKKKRLEKLRKLEEERKKLERELSVIEKELSEAELQKERLLEEEKSLNRYYMLLQDEIKKLREEVGAYRGATIVLRNLGIATDVLDALMEAQRRGELRGIKGFVASLIRYDKKYRRAIEAAAGRRLFYIITETAVDAAEAIKYLKKKGLGRASFIPLDKIIPHVVEVPRGSKVIGRALDLVVYDRTLKRAMEYVFGDTVVVEDIDTARRIEGVRCVTLDGDIVERSGVMTGGSTKGESVLSLFEAEKKRAELREKELELKDVVNKLQEIRRKLDKVNSRIMSLTAKRESLRSKLKKEVEVEEIDLGSLEEKMESIREEMREIAEKIGELELQRSKLSEKIKRSGSEELSKLNDLRRRQEILINEVKEYEALIREKKERLRALEERKDRIEKDVKEIEEDKKRNTQEIARLENELVKIKEKIEEVKERVQKQRKDLEELIKEKEIIDKEIKELGIIIGRISRRITDMEKEETALVREKSILEGRFKEVEKEFNEAEGEIIELPPDPERRLREILHEMSELEPVNLRAIEEYEEVKERVEKAREKVERLEEERRAVLRMMEEIEKKKREVFMETFRELAKKFEEVYRELVGGRARLKLTDNDPFKAGLIIEATPKGKTLTNMDALSGGEKAMVALAFIFATALFKPAPFYVLDEPDLMLDKINAERMAKYIKRLSRRSQFLVVSHRDVVLKEADQIIGVYLSKDGSSLVEIKVPQASSQV